MARKVQRTTRRPVAKVETTTPAEETIPPPPMPGQVLPSQEVVGNRSEPFAEGAEEVVEPVDEAPERLFAGPVDLPPPVEEPAQLPVVPPGAPLYHDLLSTVIDNQRMTGQKFYAVVCPEDDYPRIEGFDHVADLQALLESLIGQDVAVFPFLGNKLSITRGPLRYLVTPFGHLPLFSLPSEETLEQETDGYLGDAPRELLAPQSGGGTRAAVTDDDVVGGAEADEEEDTGTLMDNFGEPEDPEEEAD